MFRNLCQIVPLAWIVVALLAPGVSRSGDAYVAAFLDIPVDARSLAVGVNPATATWGPSGVFGNPGNAALGMEKQIEFAYGSLYGGFGSGLGQQQGVFARVPLRGHAGLGLAIVRFAVDDIPRYGALGTASFTERLTGQAETPDGSPLGYFSDSEIAFFAAFGRSFPVRLALNWFVEKIDLLPYVGVSFKVLHQLLDRFSARGAGFDAGGGVIINLRQFSETWWLGKFNIAWTGRDLGGTVLTWNNRIRETRSHSTAWGIGYRVVVRGGIEMGSFWQERSGDNELSSAGVSLGCRGVQILAGYGAGRVGLALGIALKGVELAYGFRPAALGSTHRIDVTWSLR